MQLQFHTISFEWRNRRECTRMIVSYLCRDLDGLLQFFKRMPVATFHDAFVALQIRFVTDNDTVVLRVEFHDVNRLRRGDAEPLTLADGVKLDTVVFPQDRSVKIYDLAAMFLDKVGLLEKSALVVVRHKTDFHALLLVRRLEVAMPRHFARIALGFPAKRKQRACELILPERKKEITLVLPRIMPALEQPARAVRAFLHPREMSGGDEICAELVRTVDQPAELQILVAHHARIRRAPGLIFIGKVLDDEFLKIRRFIHQIIRDF